MKQEVKKVEVVPISSQIAQLKDENRALKLVVQRQAKAIESLELSVALLQAKIGE